MSMPWSELKFGKHAGKTLPVVILNDPDWLFWAVDNQALTGPLARQAKEIIDKAQNIKIPRLRSDEWDVEYHYERDGRFRCFEIVECGQRPEYGPSERAPCLSFLAVRRFKSYD